MKVVVTGAAGFIGSHTAEAFAARGDEVLAIDNFTDNYDIRQKYSNANALKKKGIAILGHDLRSSRARDAIEEFMPDVIIHIGALGGVRYSIKRPHLYMDVNVTATQNVLDAARTCRSFVVFASSSSVYGNRTNVPFRETDNVDHPISPYAASKKACELIAYAHHHINKLPLTCLRFFTVYGPRGRPDMAPYKFMDRILNDVAIDQYGDGSTSRDYTFIKDIVDGILLAADHPDGYKVYNLGNGKPVVLLDFIRTIEEVVGKKANINIKPMQPGDVVTTYADISRAQKDFGYNPTIPLKEGLTALYQWFKDEKNW